MCVVNKQFVLLVFVLDSVYADLQYDEIYLTVTAGSVCLYGRPWSVCEVVSYVDAVVSMTVMHVLLFVVHLCMLRECKGARLTAMLVLGTGEVW